MLLNREGARIEGDTKDLDVGHICSPSATDGEAQQLGHNAGDVDSGEAEEVELVQPRDDDRPDEADDPSSKGRDG